MTSLPTEDDWSMFRDYLAAIDRKIVAAGGKDWNCLSTIERTVIDAYLFDAEFSNGEFEQFFLNPIGDRWRETLAALRTIGATQIAELFEQALSAFPNGTPSDNQLTRCHEYDAAGEPARKLMRDLSDKWYVFEQCPNETFFPALIAYVKAANK